MQYAQLIFSPTGGTQRAAEAVTRLWSEEVQMVDLTAAGAELTNTEFQEGDLVLLAVPSYGGRVPALAAQRLGQIKGNGAFCALLCVYGNRAYEDTLVELQDLAEACGFRVIAAAAAIAEHSILRQYAAGRPDGKDLEALEKIAWAILEKFRGPERAKPVTVPGKRPYKKAGGAGMVPKAGKDCVRCGLCAARCPAGAISAEKLETADGKKCIACMRCVTECPRKARSVNTLMLSAAALALKKACSVRKECELYL